MSPIIRVKAPHEWIWILTTQFKVNFVRLLIRTWTLRCWLPPTFPKNPGQQANAVELSPETSCG
eukprot:945916-Amphidinium_carterae.1